LPHPMIEMMSKTIRFLTSSLLQKVTYTKIIVTKVRRKGRSYKSVRLKAILALHLKRKKMYPFKDK